MSKKKSEIEKSTRKIIEANSEMIRIKNGQVKWKKKAKKKKIRLAQQSCFHWKINSNGKERPMLDRDPDRPGYWKCRICKKSFPIVPLEPTTEDPTPYATKTEEMLELVNQIAFWSVKCGGDSKDTEMFLRLKMDLERFKKVAKTLSRRVRKKNEVETKHHTETSSQFDVWTGFGYRSKG